MTGRLAPLPWLLALGLTACAEDPPIEPLLAVPGALAVTDSGAATPFSEPVAYAANRVGGRIQPLATRSGTFLADDPEVTFLRGSPLATGRARVLSAVAVWTPDAERVTVFALDQRFGQLLEVPHVIAVADGAPVEPVPTVTEPVVSGDLTVGDVRVTSGFTTTEDWSLVYVDDQWVVTGSRSGRLAEGPVTGAPWTSPSGELGLTIDGAPAEGDTIRLSTDSGVVEHDLGGEPVLLAMAPDGSSLAVVVRAVGGDHELVWWDPAAAAPERTVALPGAVDPVALAWTDPSLGEASELLVADAGAAQVLRAPVGEAPMALPVPAPALDVAHLDSEEHGEHLVLVTADGTTLWDLDLATGEPIDLQPGVDGVQGMRLESPATGLAALRSSVTWPAADPDDEGPRSRAVAISQYRGAVVFYGEGTGCLISSTTGPRTDLLDLTTTQSRDYSTNFEQAEVLGEPSLRANRTNNRHVQVDRCAGRARPDEWTVTYDGTLGAWRVEGDLGGVQQRLAYDDQRYTTDDGTVSFTIDSGNVPAEDGWAFRFRVLSGAHEALGDGNGDGDTLDVLDAPIRLPGDPVVTTLQTPLDDTPSPYLLVPLQSGDQIVRIRPSTGLVDVVWD